MPLYFVWCKIHGLMFIRKIVVYNFDLFLYIFKQRILVTCKVKKFMHSIVSLDLDRVQRPL